MGSASSKTDDVDPKHLGADPNDPHAFSLHQHPYYNQSGHDKIPPQNQNQDDGSLDDARDGKQQQQQQQQQQQYYADQHNTSEAMDVDPPSTSLVDNSYLNGDVVPGPAQLDVIAELNGGDHADAAHVAMAPREDVVPMVFKWEHGGRNVFITGTFNGWDKQCPMHRSGNDFTYIANLTRGKHMYKFVVDDDWRFAPDQLTMADVEGNVNNYVDVSEFATLSDFDGKNKSLDDDDDDAENPYSRYIPEIDEYTKEPPPLPPHLRHIILNKVRRYM